MKSFKCDVELEDVILNDIILVKYCFKFEGFWILVKDYEVWLFSLFVWYVLEEILFYYN